MTELENMTIETRAVELPKTQPQQDYADMPVPTGPEKNATSDKLAEMSVRELLAFCRGCLTNHRYSMARFIVQVAASLVSESENTATTDVCRALAGRLAREYLSGLARDLSSNRDGDPVPFCDEMPF